MLLDRVSVFERITFFFFRLAIGFFTAFHGLQNLGFFGGESFGSNNILIITGIVEIVAGILVGIGIFIRPAALVAAFEVAFMYYLNHYPDSLLSLSIDGEISLLYFVSFLFLAFRNIEQDINATNIYKLFKG